MLSLKASGWGIAIAVFYFSRLGTRRQQESAPLSVEARSGAAAFARELGEQG